MTKLFKIFNPLTGNYASAANEQERDALLAQTAWQLFLAHTHSTPFSIVEIQEDGSESWTAPDGSAIPSPESFDEAWKAVMNPNPTPVETLP
jgi:hypothetical protein